MTQYRQVTPKTTFMGRLRYGSDLLDELTAVCRQNRVTLGRIEAIGAVCKACIGYYDQQTHQYGFSTLDEPLEITNLSGNVSLKDGEPFVHAHVSLADESGRVHGGHLAGGTIVFACEFTIQVFDGPAFNRTLDEDTGLTLWTL